MKVIVISSKFPPEFAGSGLRAHNTYKRLKAKFGIEYDVITDSMEHKDDTTYEYEGVHIKRLSRKFSEVRGHTFISKITNHIIYTLNYLWLGILTLKELKNGKYDLIHTFGSSISVNVAMLYASYKNIGLIRELCNEGTYPSPVLPLKLNKLIKYRFRSKSKVVAISKQVADLCRQDGLNESILWERPNPINEERFMFAGSQKSALRAKLSKFKDSDIVLVETSKYEPRKNKTFMIEVVKHLEDKYKLLLFGPIVASGTFYKRDKNFYNKIIELIKQNGLESRVQVVTGFTNDIQEYYQLADVFVFPTLSEALGTPMLESIACQVPVVANRIKGITDQWIEDGRTGFTCELDPEKFASCIKKASEINRNILEDGARDILAKASTKIIDEQYFQIMTRLATS